MVSTTTALLAASTLTATSATGFAAPANSTINNSTSTVVRLDAVTKVSPRRYDITVDSPSMKQKIALSVLLPRDTTTSRSTVYMLDGAGATGAVSDWITKGDAVRFFEDKNVNVVLPAGGKGSFYTDWIHPDRVVGQPKWETFLTKELPPLINRSYNGNGRNAIVGLSMGGQAALALTARHPDLYTGAASLSGCPGVSGLVNEAYVRATVARDGADATNMWGPVGSPGWAAHDPALRPNALRNKNLYVSAGTGAIGPLDVTAPLDPTMTRQQQMFAASGLETGAYRCSLEFAVTLQANDVPATVNFPIIGTHSWVYWARELPQLWPTLARGL